MTNEMKLLIGIAGLAGLVVLLLLLSQLYRFFDEAARLRHKRDRSYDNPTDWQFWDRMLKCHYLTLIPFVNRRNCVDVYIWLNPPSASKAAKMPPMREKLRPSESLSPAAMPELPERKKQEQTKAPEKKPADKKPDGKKNTGKKQPEPTKQTPPTPPPKPKDPKKEREKLRRLREREREKRRQLRKKERAENRKLRKQIAKEAIVYNIAGILCLVFAAGAAVVHFFISTGTVIAPSPVMCSMTGQYMEFATEDLSSAWNFISTGESVELELSSDEAHKLEAGVYTLTLPEESEQPLYCRISANEKLSYFADGMTQTADAVYIKQGDTLTLMVYEDAMLDVFCGGGCPEDAAFVTGEVYIGTTAEAFTLDEDIMDVKYPYEMGSYPTIGIKRLYIGRFSDFPELFERRERGSYTWSDGDERGVKLYMYLADGAERYDSVYLLTEDNVKLQLTDDMLRNILPMTFPTIECLTIANAKYVGTSMSGAYGIPYFRYWNMYADGLRYADLSGLTTAASAILGGERLGVTDMSYMFCNQTALTYVKFGGKFDTSCVKSFEGMFKNTDVISLDLSGFDMSRVSAMREMFYDCERLTTVYVSEDWPLVESSHNMFTYCSALTGGLGSTTGAVMAVYPENYDGGTFARIDVPDAHGYFTDVAEKDEAADAELAHKAFLGPVEYEPATPDPGYVDPGYVDPGYVDPGYVDPGYVDPGYDPNQMPEFQ